MTSHIVILVGFEILIQFEGWLKMAEFATILEKICGITMQQVFHSIAAKTE